MEMINYKLKQIIFEFYWKHNISEEEINVAVELKLTELIYNDLKAKYKYITKEQLIEEAKKIYRLYDFQKVRHKISEIFPLNVTYKAIPRMPDYTFVREKEYLKSL